MKFTIGLPITKTPYLEATLKGIESQIFTDYEIVIKNNAATSEKKDEIKEICKNWIGRDNVQYFESDEHLTMTKNFNTILDKARGDYFLIMSDDDIMEPEFLSEIDILIQKYPEVKVFHGRVKRIDGNDELIDYSENCPELESQIDFVYQRLTGKRTLYLSDFVVCTKALKRDGGFTDLPKGWGIDEITWSKLGYNGIAFSNKVLLKYRRFLGNFSMSKGNLLERFADIDIMHEILEKIIIDNCKNNNSIYPLEYLLEINKERTARQKDYVLNHYAKTTNIFGIFSFYLSNKKQLTSKGLLKVILRKTFYRDKFYNAA
jgi:glycosyltransferase involved in cell wall biosynthesis